MDCPFCRSPSMARVAVAGSREVDRCDLCGALWFDYGEIRELTDGRLEVGGGGGEVDKKELREALRLLHKRVSGSVCPRCSGTLLAVDFRMTGIPVLLCRQCQGLLAPRRSAEAIEARSRFAREHRDEFQAIGEAMAGAIRRRLDLAYPPSPELRAVPVPLPIVVPLSDETPSPAARPLATWVLIGILLAVHAAGRISGTSPALPGGFPGLPPGAGFGALSFPTLLAAPFLHGGLIPLVVGCLFLFVLGDNVEDRMGRAPFLVLFLAGGAVSGAAHVLWGKAAHPPALGCAGAVAAVLGAYLLFFPQVEIRMYRLGEVVSAPAYVFACAWIAAAFLLGPGPLAPHLNPSPLTLPGHVAGFSTGLLAAVLWRLGEEARVTGPARS